MVTAFVSISGVVFVVKELVPPPGQAKVVWFSEISVKVSEETVTEGTQLLGESIVFA